MNILFYIPEIHQAMGGVRQYSVSLLKILANDKSNKYFVYHDVHDPEVIQILETNNHLTHVQSNNLRSLVRTSRINKIKRAGNILYRICSVKKRFKYEKQIDLLCKQYKIDIIHCPYQFVPETKFAKLITTLHDVQELHFPEFFTPEERADRAINYLDFLTRSNKIVVSYSHIKNDLINLFSIPSEKIDVILLDMGKLWFEKFLNSDVLPLLMDKIPKPYLLYPANTWKHKNHIRLLKAIAWLRNIKSANVNVICTGHLNSHYYNEIEPLLHELHLESNVSFIGVVEESSLFSLYKNAVGVIVPTLYEAGSFPLMESIILNVPVICSSVTSLPETIREPQFTFDPTDIEAMALVIKRIWEDVDFRKKNKSNSLKIELELKNNNALIKFIDLYGALVGNEVELVA